jgi:hypothetical protein
MTIRNLLVVLIVLVATQPLRADDHGSWQFATRPSRVVPFPYVSVVNDGVEVYYPDYAEAQFDRGYGSRWRPVVAPWRYAPDPYCQPPACLPSYYRPIFPRSRPQVGLLSVAAVLARLKRLDYSAFGAISLAGANYSIDALNQHGNPVRLIVNGDTGQIRRILP